MLHKVPRRARRVLIAIGAVVVVIVAAVSLQDHAVPVAFYCLRDERTLVVPVMSGPATWTRSVRSRSPGTPSSSRFASSGPRLRARPGSSSDSSSILVNLSVPGASASERLSTPRRDPEARLLRRRQLDAREERPHPDRPRRSAERGSAGSVLARDRVARDGDRGGRRLRGDAVPGADRELTDRWDGTCDRRRPGSPDRRLPRRTETRQETATRGGFGLCSTEPARRGGRLGPPVVVAMAGHLSSSSGPVVGDRADKRQPAAEGAQQPLVGCPERRPEQLR